MKAYILPVLYLLLFATCKKSSNETQLPPLTHTGQNILAYRVNGKTMIVSGNKKNSFNKSTGVIVISYANKDIYIDAVNSELYEIAFEFNYSKSLGTYQLINSYPYTAAFLDNSSSGIQGNKSFVVNSIYGGTISINYFENNILSGTFAFDAINNNDSVVHITDGRFDIAMD